MGGAHPPRRIQNPSLQPVHFRKENGEEFGSIPGWGFGREVGQMLQPSGFAQDFIPFPAMPLPSYQVSGPGGRSVNDTVAGQPAAMNSRRMGVGLGFNN